MEAGEEDTNKNTMKTAVRQVMKQYSISPKSLPAGFTACDSVTVRTFDMKTMSTSSATTATAHLSTMSWQHHHGHHTDQTYRAPSKPKQRGGKTRGIKLDLSVGKIGHKGKTFETEDPHASETPKPEELTEHPDRIIRIGCYNVHGWKDGEKRRNALRVAKTLLKTKVDIVGLNEVWHKHRGLYMGSEEEKLIKSTFTEGVPTHDDDAPEYATETILEAVSRMTHLRHHIFGGAIHDLTYGNAIMSRYPITRHATFPLKSRSHPEEEHRSLVIAEFELPPRLPPFAVCCVHLDHRYEQARLEQLDTMMKRVQGMLGEGDSEIPHLLLGDFNAVRRIDYRDEYWQKELIEAREARGWEPAYTHVTDKIESLGYVDTMEVCGGEEWCKLIEQDRSATCWNGVRIDYIYASKRFLQSFDLVKSRIVTVADASDHYPMVLEVRPKQSKPQQHEY